MNKSQTSNLLSFTAIFLLGVMLLLVPFSYAQLDRSGGFDISKSYNPDTKTALLKEGCIPFTSICATTLGQAQLKSAQEEVVPIGYGKVAEFEVTSYEDYEQAISNFKFYDLNRDGIEVQRNVDFKEKVESEISVPYYSENPICSNVWNSINQTFDNICKYEIVGEQTVTKVDWVNTTLDFSQDETKTIGVFTNVRKGDNIEWVGEFFGHSIPEWSSWIASVTDVGLIAYYNCSSMQTDQRYNINTSFDLSVLEGNPYFETSSSPFTNNVSCAVNGTLDAGDIFQINVIGNEFTSNLNETGTISVWVYFKDVMPNDNNVFLSAQDSWDLRILDTNHIATRNFMDNEVIGSSDYTHQTPITPNTWHNIVLMRNTTNSCIFVDGLQNCSAKTTSLVPSIYSLRLGTDHYADGYGANMNFDEIGIWNTSKTTQEIIDIYTDKLTPDSTSGDVDAPFFVVVPANLTLEYNQPINATFSASDDVELTDFQINDTRFTINLSGYFTNTSKIGVGFYDLNISITDGLNYNSTIWSINVTQAPSITKTYLNGTEGNFTATENSTFDLASTLALGEVGGNLSLFLNDNIIDSTITQDFLLDVVTLNTTGIYNITSIYYGNQNYTSSSETWFLNITTIPIVSPPIVNPNPPVTSTPIYQALNSAGAGLAIFIQVLIYIVPRLLLLIAVVGFVFTVALLLGQFIDRLIRGEWKDQIYW